MKITWNCTIWKSKLISLYHRMHKSIMAGLFISEALESSASAINCGNTASICMQIEKKQDFHWATRLIVTLTVNSCLDFWNNSNFCSAFTLFIFAKLRKGEEHRFFIQFLIPFELTFALYVFFGEIAVFITLSICPNYSISICFARFYIISNHPGLIWGSSGQSRSLRSATANIVF